MSKQWKCSECVKHGTDACYNGSRFDDDNCKYVLIDSDYAYEQGRADAIDEYFNKMQSVAFGNRKGLIHFKDILSIREQLKEQNNE